MESNVLIVDDSSFIRKRLKSIFRNMKYDIANIYEAENGRKGLKILNKNNINLIFLDLNMPVLNGFEVIDILERENILKKIPVIIISCDGNISRIESLLSRGIKAFIRKPFSLNSIQRILEELKSEDIEDIEPVLGKVLSHILKDFKFSFADIRSIKDISVDVAEFDYVSMIFEGIYNGILGITLSKKLSKKMLDYFNVSEELDQEDRVDIIKEFANLLCGHYLTNMFGKLEEFNMYPPFYSKIDSSLWKRIIRDSNSITFLVEGELLAAHIFFKNETFAV